MLRSLTTQPLGKRLTVDLAERRPYNEYDARDPDFSVVAPGA